MNIPNGWKKVKFGDVVSKVNDKVPNRDEWTFDRYIGGQHFDEGEIRVTQSAPIEGNEEVIGSAFHMRFKPGHVLYVTRNPRLRKGGMVDFEGVCSNVSFVMQADETKLLQSLLSFVIQTEDFVTHTCNNAHGSTNPFLNWKDIANYEFLLPPIEEQKKISEVLWSIEKNIISMENYVETLTFFKEKMLIKKYSLGKDILELVKLSRTKNHSIVKLKQLTEIITKGTTPTTYGMNFVSEGVNFVKAESIDKYGNLIKNKLAFIDENTHSVLKRSQFKSGDILFSIAGVIGRTAIVTEEMLPANTNQAIAIIRPKKEVKVEYLNYYLKSKIVKKYVDIYAVQTAQANVSLGLLGDLPVHLLNEKEQSDLIITLNKIEKFVLNNIEGLFNLKNLRNKLSNELLSGKLRLEDNK